MKPSRALRSPYRKRDQLHERDAGGTLMAEVYLPPQTVIKPRQATCTVHDLMIDNDHALGNHIGHIDDDHGT
jgi:hypothetical protein